MPLILGQNSLKASLGQAYFPLPTGIPSDLYVNSDHYCQVLSRSL
ncbi:MAG: hypothetical protein AAGE59_27055 [Cyanobacteria bacterium P01_F01_bin.86]